MSDRTVESDSMPVNTEPPEYEGIMSDETAIPVEDHTFRPTRSWMSGHEETDPILWCLTCHQPDHKSNDCSTPQETNEEGPSNGVQLQPSQRPVAKLLNIFALRIVQETEYKSFTTRRDATFIKLHDEILKRNIPEYRREIWYTNMSWWNQTIHTYFLELMSTIDRAKDRVNVIKCQSATIVEYLTRCNPQQGKKIAERMLPNLTESLKELLLNCLEMEELEDTDRIWVAKAFGFAADLQPDLEDDDMGIVRLCFPDVDDEVRTAGLWNLEAGFRAD